MLGLVFLIHWGLYIATVRWVSERKQSETTARMEALIDTIQRLNIPFNQTVLNQMRGLSGAEFQVRDDRNSVIHSTIQFSDTAQLELADLIVSGQVLSSEQDVPIGGRWYRVAQVPLRQSDPRQRRLIVFYLLEDIRREQQNAVRPIVLMGLASLAVATILAVGLAYRISRPIVNLTQQVDRIEQTQFAAIAVPARNDELRDLTIAFNQMCDRLRQYEETIRQTEQVRLLAQIRGGIAHHLKNAITGARIALDVYQSNQAKVEQNDCLVVVDRQIKLMEQYLQQFLAPAIQQRATFQSVDLKTLLNETIKLVMPRMVHFGIGLERNESDESFTIMGDYNLLQQALLNVLINSIDSVAQKHASDPGSISRQIRMTLDRSIASDVLLTIADNGVGIPVEMEGRIFEPFMTTKPDGVGLGLAIVRQVVETHAGSIQLETCGNWTVCEITLPSPRDND